MPDIPNEHVGASEVPEEHVPVEQQAIESEIVKQNEQLRAAVESFSDVYENMADIADDLRGLVSEYRARNIELEAEIERLRSRGIWNQLKGWFRW